MFDLSIGPDTPTIYVLMPGASAEKVATVENLLGKDDEYHEGWRVVSDRAREGARV